MGATFVLRTDNLGPLPLHVHHNDEKAALVGRTGKPEAYYFPPQMNNHLGTMPVSYFVDGTVGMLLAYPDSTAQATLSTSISARAQLTTP